MVLRYIYGGRLSLEEYDTSDIIKILVASSELSIQELITHLQLFLIENKKNWMEQNFSLIYKTSFENNSFLELQNFCDELIMSKEPEKIFNSTDFNSLSENCLISLIQHDNIKTNVIHVWERVLNWGISQNPELPLDPSSYSKDDFITLKNTLQQLIPFINFINLTSKEYLDKVYPYKKIIPKDLRQNLLKHFMDLPNNNSEPKMTIEIDSIATSSKQENFPVEKDFNKIIDEIYDFIYKLLNKGIDRKFEKQKVIEYFNDHYINLQEIYNWLLNNQISTNSIFLFGYFNHYGIVSSENHEKAFNLFISASRNNHTLAQFFVGNCYKYGYGTIKNEKLAFEYYENAANENILCGQNSTGYCYGTGLGAEEDFKKAFYWYEKAANNGNIKAMYNLGIGTKIDKQKAFELYQNAANLEEEVAQINLALMYEKGDGITKDVNKAIYWYEKSAIQGCKKAKNSLERLKINNL
ncbi:kinase-like domain-containing protein [Rhizophagus clarus]|uniref:Kinase-like domain-containing protein n=1 Tax=Rhizophagus clarus TaxID=94130 RepID=A0A8H3M9I7_9GLOM|nr:kinase-like domain-containing protein [Rhizophagus clarus]